MRAGWVRERSCERASLRSGPDGSRSAWKRRCGARRRGSPVIGWSGGAGLRRVVCALSFGAGPARSVRVRWCGASAWSERPLVTVWESGFAASSSRRRRACGRIFGLHGAPGDLSVPEIRPVRPTGSDLSGGAPAPPGVSIHPGHAGTIRHTHHGPGRVCRLMTVMPGRVDTPDRRWRAGAHPPARPETGTGSDPGQTPVGAPVTPPAAAAPAETARGLPYGREECTATPLPHPLTSGRSDHTKPATSETRTERAGPPGTPGRGPPAAGNDNRPPATTSTTPPRRPSPAQPPGDRRPSAGSASAA
jgi:hypothetical protein